MSTKLKAVEKPQETPEEAEGAEAGLRNFRPCA